MKRRLLLLNGLIWGGLILLFGFPMQPAERNNTGNALFGRAEFDSAIRAYQAAQVGAPDAPEAYYNAAGALVNVGRLRDAAETLEQALKTADDSLRAEIYYNLGNVYYEMARYNNAVEAYRQALRLNPADENARYNYELALLRQIPTPTSTPQEQQTDPEQDESEPTPTPNPAGQDGPTMTPTPPPDSPPDEDATPQEGDLGDLDDNQRASPTPSDGGPLTIEEVERQLDAIQENQQTLREFLNRAATPSQTNGNDW